MGLFTQCPACQTMFRLVPDQLRIAQGWVKCGQCGGVFDATQHMVNAAMLQELAPPEQPVPGPAPEQAVESTPHVAPPPPEPAPPLEPMWEPDGAEALLANQGLMHAPTPEPEVARSPSSASAPPQGLEPSLADAPADAGVDLVLDIQAAPDPEPTHEVSPRFAVTSPPAGRRWRWVWRLSALLLALLALAQAVFDQRERLAAQVPALAAPLSQICARLGCRLEGLRQIESVAVDSVVFNKLDSTHVRCQFVLKSSAPFDLAVPSVELTLTDLQEQVVVRKVLTAAELWPTVQRINPAEELMADRSLALPADLAARVAGYRLVAFYP